MRDWDLIFGNHSHVPQPITSVRVEDDGGQVCKVLAYSGGNFCSGHEEKNHKYGVIMKCEIGPIVRDPSHLAVGKVEWRFVECHSEKKVPFSEGMLRHKKPHPKMVKIVPNIDYFKNMKSENNPTCYNEANE